MISFFRISLFKPKYYVINALNYPVFDAPSSTATLTASSGGSAPLGGSASLGGSVIE